MDLKNVCGWILVNVFILIDCALHVSASYCPYITEDGTDKVRQCPGRCCSDSYEHKPVCCEFNYPSGAYVGAGVGTIIVLGVILLCTLYICCKQRILASYRRSSDNTRTRHRPGSFSHGDNIPSISASVDPILPPPYEALPPPYYTNDVETGENSAQTKTEKTQKYPDYPPPGYTEQSENAT